MYGRYVHCDTASTTGCRSISGPERTLSLFTRPSVPINAARTTIPETCAPTAQAGITGITLVKSNPASTLPKPALVLSAVSAAVPR